MKNYISSAAICLNNVTMQTVGLMMIVHPVSTSIENSNSYLSMHRTTVRAKKTKGIMIVSTSKTPAGAYGSRNSEKRQKRQ